MSNVSESGGRNGFDNFYSDDPIFLTREACRMCPLTAIDVDCPTFRTLREEVRKMTTDNSLITFNSLRLSALDTQGDLKNHSERTGLLYERALGRLVGWQQAEGLRNLGVYHDIGKLIDETLFHLTEKKGKLDEDEYLMEQEHADLSAQFLKTSYPAASAIVYGHHEFGQRIVYPRKSLHMSEIDWQTRTAMRILLNATDKAEAFLSSRRPETRPGQDISLLYPYLTDSCGFSTEIARGIMDVLPEVDAECPM